MPLYDEIETHDGRVIGPALAGDSRLKVSENFSLSTNQRTFMKASAPLTSTLEPARALTHLLELPIMAPEKKAVKKAINQNGLSAFPKRYSAERYFTSYQLTLIFSNFVSTEEASLAFRSFI